MRKRIYDEYEYFATEKNIENHDYYDGTNDDDSNDNYDSDKKRRVDECNRVWKDDCCDEIENGEIIEIDVDDENRSIIHIVDSDEELDDKETTHSTPEEEEPTINHHDTHESCKEKNNNVSKHTEIKSKNYKVSFFDSSDDDSDQNQSQSQIESQIEILEEQPTRMEDTFHSHQLTQIETQLSDEESSHFDVTDYDLAFCCTVCTCPKDHKYYSKYRNCGNSGNKYMYHRVCCHPKYTNQTKDYISPIQKAVHDGVDGLAIREPLKKVKWKELKKMIKQAGKNETMETNKIHTVESDSQMYSDPNYLKLTQKYYQLKKELQIGKPPAPAVVLDVFSGIGSAILILKKLKISMSKAIHVDIDPVARHVSKFNHCTEYNNDLYDDGIEHVYDYKKFEDLTGDNFEPFMKQHAPIDIVLGGPPCSDYSAVNAYRKGSAGTSGWYLVEFGKFIQQIQQHPLQRNVTLFFLSENVVAQEEYPDVHDAYGFYPLCVDAQRFSPCRRNRVYWTSLPVRSVDDTTEISGESSVANNILEEDWLMPAEAIEQNIPLKANTFMASKSRLDDKPRMLKVKKENGQFIESTFSVYEREIMLGLPKRYVEDAVKYLYNKLMQGFKAEFKDKDHWHNYIDQDKFQDFLFCRYRFIGIQEEPYFEPRIQIFNYGNKPSNDYLTCEQYAKRLLGNGWSIPVVEFLLRPLQEIFPKKDYGEKYDYVYHWEPYNCV